MLLHNIKRLCAEQGITIAELERKALLNEATICKWGTTMPAADKLVRVAKVLGVTIEELLEDPAEKGDGIETL